MKAVVTFDNGQRLVCDILTPRRGCTSPALAPGPTTSAPLYALGTPASLVPFTRSSAPTSSATDPSIRIPQ